MVHVHNDVYIYMYICPSICKMIHVCVCYAQTQKFVEYKKMTDWEEREKSVYSISRRESSLCLPGP